MPRPTSIREYSGKTTIRADTTCAYLRRAKGLFVRRASSPDFPGRFFRFPLPSFSMSLPILYFYLSPFLFLYVTSVFYAVPQIQFERPNTVDAARVKRLPHPAGITHTCSVQLSFLSPVVPAHVRWYEPPYLVYSTSRTVWPHLCTGCEPDATSLVASNDWPKGPWKYSDPIPQGWQTSDHLILLTDSRRKLGRRQATSANKQGAAGYNEPNRRGKYLRKILG